jgi:hypothetical protein
LKRCISFSFCGLHGPLFAGGRLLGVQSRKVSNMKLRIPLALLWLLLAVGMAYGQKGTASVSADEPSTPEAIKQFNDDKVAELSKQIAGKEDQPRLCSRTSRS